MDQAKKLQEQYLIHGAEEKIKKVEDIDKYKYIDELKQCYKALYKWKLCFNGYSIGDLINLQHQCISSISKIADDVKKAEVYEDVFNLKERCLAHYTIKCIEKEEIDKILNQTDVQKEIAMHEWLMYKNLEDKFYGSK